MPKSPSTRVEAKSGEADGVKKPKTKRFSVCLPARQYAVLEKIAAGGMAYPTPAQVAAFFITKELFDEKYSEYRAQVQDGMKGSTP